MKRLLLWTFDRPAVAVALTVLITIALAVQLPKLQLDPSAEGLMIQHDPARTFYDQVKRRFGSDSLTVVVVKADDVFAPPVLRTIKRLSDGLERVEGVTRVESLTTVRNIKGRLDSLDTEPLVGADVPDDPAGIARIRADALGNRVFVGNLVAPDARATVITIYTESRPRDVGFNERFTTSVEALIAKETAPGRTIYQVGSIFARVTNQEYIDRDNRTVVPLSTAMLLLVLFLGFRTPQGVVIPVVTALVSIVWGVGMMAWTGIPMNLLTAVIPSLLIAIGFTEDVHMIAEYHHRLEHGLAKVDAIRGMLAESALPLLITTATTVIGFGMLIFTDVTMLIQFGQASSMALIGNFVATLLILPCMLRYWPVPK